VCYSKKLVLGERAKADILFMQVETALWQRLLSSLAGLTRGSAAHKHLASGGKKFLIGDATHWRRALQMAPNPRRPEACPAHSPGLQSAQLSSFLGDL
jgi:hypothetical protein